ncbi:MAG: ATP-binding protein [bacterium]
MGISLDIRKMPIRYRIVFLSVIPLLIITVLLTSYTIQTRRSEIGSNILLMAETRAGFAASRAELAVYAQDQNELNQIIDDTLQIESTAGVMFLDRSLSTLLTSNAFPVAEASPVDIVQRRHLEEAFYYFAHPVHLTGIDVSDYADPDAREDELIGWVIIALDISAQRKKLEQIIQTSALFAGLGFVLALIIALVLSRSIVTPVRHLTRTVSRIHTGDYSARANEYAAEELSILAEGINQMASAIEASTSELESRVLDKTRQLHNTLAILQQKNQELVQATDISERANRAKSEFLARMSHELRTPLTSIQGFARLLSQPSNEAALEQYTSVIDQAAAQLLTLIDDILDFSKLQSNTVVLNKESLNIFDLLEQTVAMFSQIASEKHIYLELDLEPSVAPMREGDAKRVKQIINNLVSNAVKFTSRGGVTVTVSETPSKDRLIISVEDSGIGIRESQRAGLFQAFAQADTSISRNFGGTGLGLAISKSLVELMGGNLSFQSQPGKGSTFVAALPLPALPAQPEPINADLDLVVWHECGIVPMPLAHQCEILGVRTHADADAPKALKTEQLTPIFCVPATPEPESALYEKLLAFRKRYPENRLVLPCPITMIGRLFSRQQSARLEPLIFIPTPTSRTQFLSAIDPTVGIGETESTAQRFLEGMNILIAEDSQLTSLLLETLVEQYGAQFSTATNGAEAVKISRSEPFDILLIDVHMPELSGIDAIREIRSSDGVNKRKPIIALTADLLQQEKPALMEAGANEIILKPFDEQKLLAAIKRLTGLTKHLPGKSADANDKPLDELFFSEFGQLLDNLDAAIQAENWDDAGEMIHGLLGITRIFKPRGITDPVEQLRAAGKVRDIDQSRALIQGIRESLVALKGGTMGQSASDPHSYQI